MLPKTITSQTLTDTLGAACYRLQQFQTSENVQALQNVLKHITQNIELLSKQEAQALLGKVETSLRLIVQGADPEGPLRPLILQQEQQFTSRLRQLVGQLFRGQESAKDELQRQCERDNTFRTAAQIADIIVQNERKSNKLCCQTVFDFFAGINIKGIQNFTMGQQNTFENTQQRLSRRIKRIKEKMDELQKHLLAYTAEERKNEQEAYQRSFCNSVLEISMSQLRRSNQAAFKTISFFRPYLSKYLVVDIANLLQQMLRQDLMRYTTEMREAAIRVLDKDEPVAFQIKQTKVYSIRRELMNIEYVAADTQQPQYLDIPFGFKACDFVAQTVEDCKICLLWLQCNIFRINNHERELVTRRVMQQITEQQHAFCRYCAAFAQVIDSHCLREWIAKQALRLGLDAATLE